VSDTGTTAAIVVEDVRKTYGDLTAVDGVSLTVAEGEFFGILGPNGAGKTTTLEIIEGLREPDAGTVRLLGRSPWPRDTALLPRIGVQLQASAFFEKLTAREQLETFASLYGVGAARAGEVLELVGLADKADTREDRLSGGQRQRLSIACALVHDPDVVFLDEPTAALDPQARRNLWDVLRAIQDRGKTILYTTHYLDEAEMICDRVAIMDRGRILAMDAPATLVRGLDAPTRVILERGALSTADAAALPGADDVVEAGPSLTISTRRPADVLTALADRRALAGLQVRTATLEDVFLELTGREYRA
jgi:ABC-2 type transport system ATP-binding protein